MGKVAAGSLTITDLNDLTRNLLDPTRWVVGSVGSQEGFPERTSRATYENFIVMGDDPFGNRSPLWKCVAEVTSPANNDGGWETTYVAIDPLKTYRFRVWLRRETTADGYSYWGIKIPAANLLRKLDGTLITTDYTYLSGAGFRSPAPAGKWFLLVGYVHGNGTPLTTSVGGMYDPATGLRLSAYPFVDLKWELGVSQAKSIAYQWSSTVNGTTQYFFNPVIELCDGNELTIDTILGGAASAYKIASMADDTKITVQEKYAVLPRWMELISNLDMTTAVPTGNTSTVGDGSFKTLRDRAVALSIWTPTTAGTEAKAYYDAMEALRAYLFTTPAVLRSTTTALWEATVTVVKADWLARWNLVKSTSDAFVNKIASVTAVGTVATNTPKYLGSLTYAVAEVAGRFIGDYYLCSTTNASPVRTAGLIYDYSGTAWAQTTNEWKYMVALDDLMLLSTETAKLTAIFQRLVVKNGFIDNLQVKHISGADGSFSGAIDTAQIKTRGAITAFSVTKSVAYSQAAFVGNFSTLSVGYNYVATGTFNSKTAVAVLKGKHTSGSVYYVQIKYSDGTYSDLFSEYNTTVNMTLYGTINILAQAFSEVAILGEFVAELSDAGNSNGAVKIGRSINGATVWGSYGPIISLKSTYSGKSVFIATNGDRIIFCDNTGAWGAVFDVNLGSLSLANKVSAPLGTVEAEVNNTTDGYIKYSSGTLHVWKTYHSPGTGEETWTFPHAFIDTNWVLSSTALRDSALNSCITSIVRTRSTSQALIRNVYGSGLATENIAYHAVGRWKV